MNESAKFEIQQKKLQGICEENELLFTLRVDRYPITLTIKSNGTEAQTSFLDHEDDEPYRSPNAELVFMFVDGALSYRYTETFSIDDALLGKLKNIFTKMYSFWLQYFFRNIMERGIVAEKDMPVIEPSDDDAVDEAMQGLGEDAEPIESVEDDDDSDGNDGYEYDEREDSDGEPIS